MKQKKKSKRTDESVQPQSPELDAEQVPSNVSEDSTLSRKENIMSRKFNFESLAVVEKKQSLQDEADYQDLLRQVAADQCTLTDEQVLEIIQRAGRDARTLEEDAAERAERDRQIAEVRREAEYQEEADKLTVELREMWADFQAYKEAYENKERPIEWKRNQLLGKIRTIHDYRDNLRDSCKDVNLRLEIEMLESQWDDRPEHALRERKERVNRELDDIRREAAEKRIRPDHHEWKRAIKARIKELETEVEQIELKLLDIETKKAEYKAALEQKRELLIFA